MNFIIFIPVLASFLIAALLLPVWIRRAKQAGLAGKDMNKYEKIEVAEAGGVPVVAAFTLSVLLYIAIITFYFKSTDHLIEIFALLSSIVIVSFIGLIDDILGWKIGLGRKIRILLVFLAAIPLMAINAGKSIVFLPFIGNFDLGLLYPLLIIPLGMTGATTTFNFLAGFNGLEAGQGILLLTAFGLIAYLTGTPWLALICLIMIAAILVFLSKNKCPASVFPGDSLTYAVGGLLACISILGNFEKIAVFLFIPYILETILKLRGRLQKQSFGKPNKDNTLEMPYSKIYGLEHLAIYLLKKAKIKATEKSVVYLIWGFQTIIILLGLLMLSYTLS